MRRALSVHQERDRIDPDRAAHQHAAYVRALERAGVSVVLLAPEPDLPDACFTWDTMLAFPRAGTVEPTALLVAARPGEPSRRPEVESVVECARGLAADAELIEIREPGTLDGGDVITYGSRVAIGVSARTNEHGANQLARAVERYGYRALPLPGGGSVASRVGGEPAGTHPDDRHGRRLPITGQCGRRGRPAR